MSKKVYQEGIAIYKEYGFEEMEFHFSEHLLGFTGDDKHWGELALLACSLKEWRLVNDVLQDREGVLKLLLRSLGEKNQTKTFLELTKQPVVVSQNDPQLLCGVSLVSLIKEKVTLCDTEIFRWSFSKLKKNDVAQEESFQVGIILPYLLSERFAYVSDSKLKKSIANTLLGDQSQHKEMASILGPVLKITPTGRDILKDILRHLDDVYAFSFFEAMKEKYPNADLPFLDEVQSRKLHREIYQALENPTTHSSSKKQM